MLNVLGFGFIAIIMAGVLLVSGLFAVRKDGYMWLAGISFVVGIAYLALIGVVALCKWIYVSLPIG